MKIRRFKGCREFYRKSRYKKGGYLIRLTRGYTDGEMDIRDYSAQMFAPPSVYSRVRRA